MSETKVVTGKVRFSYAHVFEPQTGDDEGAKPKYSVSLIIPKKDTATLKKIEAAIEAAKVAGASKFGGKVPKNLKTPLRDGDLEREDDPNYADSMFMTASTTRKPQIVDASLDEIMSKEDFYSGCFGRASVNFYAYANKSNGVACGLNNIQKMEDGDRLGAEISTAAADFGDDLL
jgi:hypothetical protein